MVKINIDDYLGMRSGMLEVIGISEKLPNEKKYRLVCKCDCGNTSLQFPYQIKGQKVKSCGCVKSKLVVETRKHIKGHKTEDNRSKHPLYGTWFLMISRCENIKNKRYSEWGGRGIKVCDEWHDFWNFVKWSDSVGGRPKGYTIDRIDNNGNYEPSNCRWASRSQQQNNTSANVKITYNDETKTIAEWSKITGIKHQTLLGRYNSGWSADKIIETIPITPKYNSFNLPPIIQTDMNGNFICKYESKSLIPSIYRKKSISECCNGRRKSYKGYIWKYENK